ncbi:MFS transporter [Pedobacter sp. ISL-68]|uniref:MFS transporter n=1 Tax=unclassified Pedobacter TaxID=2628915 RepID=UPI001BE54721|nr:MULTISPECIES: MFS transporter [unclassified Pedobacter]MBT2560248.1 MFS transporter [Pedobacter sp. ISL-64]MBT2589228.1 MFS transporter [Pedobacter sp. ISL-68]
MLKKQNERFATWLAFALIPLPGFATDIYIPSLPNMGRDLHTGSLEVQLTLTLFLVSYGLSQIFIGSILDSYGRYKFSTWAIVIFTLASLCIAVTDDIYLIYLMRVIHGITVAIIVVAKRAFFVDRFEGTRLKNYLSLFTIIWSAGPILAPFLGGYLESLFGWYANFYFLAAYGAIFCVLELMFSGETLKIAAGFQLKRVVRVYIEMFNTTDFTLGVLMLCFAYAMVMIYNMTGPYIIEHHLGLSPTTAGNASFILGMAWMLGGFIGKATIEKPFYKKLLLNGALQVFFALLMIFSVNYASNLYSLVLFAFIIHVGAGFTYNNYFTYCLSRFPKNAGIAGGLTGGSVYIILSIFTYCIIAHIPAKDEANLSYSYLILIFPSFLLMWYIFKRQQRQLASMDIKHV